MRRRAVTIPISQDHCCYSHRSTIFHIQSTGVTSHISSETALENPVSPLIRKEFVSVVFATGFHRRDHLAIPQEHGHGCFTLRQHVCLQLIRSGRCPHSREVFCIAFFTSTGVWVLVFAFDRILSFKPCHFLCVSSSRFAVLLRVLRSACPDYLDLSGLSYRTRRFLGPLCQPLRWKSTPEEHC